jgi:hypothetical protein
MGRWLVKSSIANCVQTFPDDLGGCVGFVSDLMFRKGECTISASEKPTEALGFTEFLSDPRTGQIVLEFAGDPGES